MSTIEEIRKRVSDSDEDSKFKILDSYVKYNEKYGKEVLHLEIELDGTTCQPSKKYEELPVTFFVGDEVSEDDNCNDSKGSEEKSSDSENSEDDTCTASEGSEDEKSSDSEESDSEVSDSEVSEDEPPCSEKQLFIHDRKSVQIHDKQMSSEV